MLQCCRAVSGELLSITVIISHSLSIVVINRDRQSLSSSHINRLTPDWRHSEIGSQTGLVRLYQDFVVTSAMSAFMVAWMTFVALLALALGSAVDDRKPNTVFVAILIRNKAHTLPYFFSALESLDYPKDRMHLW